MKATFRKTTMRAIRRHHRARLIAERGHHFGRTLSPAEAAKAARTPKPCSCSMCGNPRRYFGEFTIQERRATRAEEDER
jgi:hypothetical protein